jgi:hypothetical protein
MESTLWVTIELEFVDGFWRRRDEVFGLLVVINFAVFSGLNLIPVS